MRRKILLRLLRGMGLAAASAVLTAGSCRNEVGKGDQPGIYTVRVSVDADGNEAVGTALGAIGSQFAAVSQDGRFVAFQSDAVNLVNGDGNGFRDIFVKDRTNGAVELVSFNSDAQLPSNGNSSNPSVSADGRYVVFESEGRLATGTSGSVGFPIVYWHDRFTKTTRFVAGGIVPAGSGKMLNPTVSLDGRFVAFEANMSDMQTPPPHTYVVPPTTSIIYVSDMSTSPPAITMVSHQQGAATTGANGLSFNAKISQDGSVVVFSSDATNLTLAADANGHRDVFAGTPGGADCTLVSRRDTPLGAQCDSDSSSASVSSNGQFVAFTTSDSIIGGGMTVIAVRDRIAGTTVAVSAHPGGGVVLNPDVPSISDDGQMIAFRGDLTSTGGAGNQQIWVRNLSSGASQLASLHLSGATAAADCDRPSISGNGVWVAFDTPAANLITVDANGQSDIFMRGPLR